MTSAPPLSAIIICNAVSKDKLAKALHASICTSEIPMWFVIAFNITSIPPASLIRCLLAGFRKLNVAKAAHPSLCMSLASEWVAIALMMVSMPSTMASLFGMWFNAIVHRTLHPSTCTSLDMFSAFMDAKICSIPPHDAMTVWHSDANANDIKARQASICTLTTVTCAAMAFNINSTHPCWEMRVLFLLFLNAKLCNKLQPNSCTYGLC